MMVKLPIQLHHLLDIERFDCAAGGHAQRVADEVEDMMILDYRRKGGEGLTLFRLFDIGLDGCQTFLPRTAEQLEQHLEGVQIELGRESGPLEDSNEASHDLLQDVKRVGDQDGAGRRACDNHHLGRLHQDQQVALFHQVSADNRADDYYNSDNREHKN